jgi:hypothetical protein
MSTRLNELTNSAIRIGGLRGNCALLAEPTSEFDPQFVRECK